VEKTVFNGMSFGLSHAGYDIRIAESLRLPHGSWALASSIERFKMPDNVIGFVHDKSSWARRGIAVQNTVIEPGWEGYLTLELSNHNCFTSYHTSHVDISKGSPIAQVVFHWLDEPTDTPYTGKYQNQEAGPQAARYEV
jgi:dCTP deaminase